MRFLGVWGTSILLLLSLCSLRGVNPAPLENYVRVERRTFSSCRTISLYPEGWMVKAVKSMRRDDQYIKEVVYIPSTLPPVLAADASTHASDDDHLASYLADQGFIVHCLLDLLPSTFTASVAEVLKWRSLTTPPRSLAVVSHELSCSRLLSYLADVALPMGTSRVDIGAVVLIDPPPLLLLRSGAAEQVLQSHYCRYLHSVANPRGGAKLERLVQTRLFGTRLRHSVATERVSDSFERRVLQRGPELHALLLRLQLHGASNEAANDALAATPPPEPGDDSTWRSELQLLERGEQQERDPFLRQWQQQQQLLKIKYSVDAGAGIGVGRVQGAAPEPLTAACIVGSCPTLQQARDVGSALHNRLLLINTFKRDDEDEREGEEEEEEEEEEEWSLRNCRELAATYNAGPVLSFDDAFDEEEGQEGVAGEEGAEDGKAEAAEASAPSVWHAAAKRKHLLLGTAISDWLAMLTTFDYL